MVVFAEPQAVLRLPGQHFGKGQSWILTWKLLLLRNHVS
jgi:hypothetical protein